MAAAEEYQKPQLPEIGVRKDGMNIDFKDTPNTTKFIVTFIKVDPDAFKLTFHQVLPNGDRHDLLYREGPIPIIIVYTDLHVTRETANQIWSYLTTETKFMTPSQTNVHGQSFAELTVRVKDKVKAVLHYLESIAESKYRRDKRTALREEADRVKAQRMASAEESKKRREALKSTPEYKEQEAAKKAEKDRLDAEAAAAAAAKRDEHDKPPVGPRVRKPTGSRGGTRRRPSRKYKKSKRVLRRKSRSTRRR